MTGQIRLELDLNSSFTEWPSNETSKTDVEAESLTASVNSVRVMYIDLLSADHNGGTYRLTLSSNNET